MIKKLFAIYLWWKHENWFIEAHDIVFCAAESKDEAKKIAKQKTMLKEDIHCDWIIQIENVDGYDISLVNDWSNECISYDTTYQKL